MLSVLGRWGIWKRAGMSAAVAGLDLAEAMRSLPPCGLDRDFARRLFVIAEAFFIPAALQYAKDNTKDD